MEIVPDPFLVALFLPPFLVALIGSWLVLWRPLQAWMDERDAASADARAEASRLDTEVDERLVSLKERLGSVRADITEMRNSARVEASAHERELLSAARTEAETKVSAAAAEIGQQTEIARRGLADAARTIADDMAHQVLGRPVDGGSVNPGQA